MKWFKHESNANRDAKLIRVMMKYGMQGYGVYWFCLELIAQTVEKHNLTFELEHDSEMIAAATGMRHETIQGMMVDFVKWKLFDDHDGIIFCLKMAIRTDEYTRQLMRSVDKLPRESTESHDKLHIMSQLREEKEEKREREVPKLKKFKAPSLLEVTQYCQEQNNTINPQTFIDFYETNGWMQGTKKIKSWKACVRTWQTRESQKSPGISRDDWI